MKPYAVTKAAQIHLAKGLAIIAAPKIRVNTVSPGLMLTVCLERGSRERCTVADDGAGMGPEVLP